MNALRHATTFARDLPARCGIGSAALFWALLAVLVASAAWMLGHDPPWDSEAARRIAEGKKLKPEHYGATGLWWAAAANALLAAGALAFAKLWSPGLATADPAPLLEPGRWRKAFAFALLAAVLCGAILRAPRLTHSLWNDEEYSARTYVWGKFEPSGGGGALEFKPVTWAEAAWKNKVNNHLLHTFEARLSLKAWQAMAGRGPEAFSEAALRFFPFLSGVGTIALVGLLGAMAAGPRAGIAAAILLAISPWHLRYSVEARGYATMMFCMAAALCCLLPALRTGRWRWWLGYAAAQAGYLLCFLGSIYVFALGNAAAAAIILAGRGYRGARGRWLSRLGVANVATLLLFAPAIAPSVPQIAEYMDDPIAVEGGMGAAWLRDFWTHLTLGFPWESQLDGEHLGTSAETLGKANILAKAWVAWIAPVLGGAGIALLLWRGWRGRLIAAALAGGAAAAVAESWATGSPMHIWYLIYATMALAIALGAAAAEAARLGRWARIGAPALLILCAGYACADPLYRIRTFDRQPMREVIEKIRGEAPAAGTDDGAILTASLGVSDRQIQTYDPRAHIVESLDDLKALEARARSEGKALYAYYCGKRETTARLPEVVARLDESRLYDEIGKLEGLQEFWSYRAFRFRKPPAAAGGDAEN